MYIAEIAPRPSGAGRMVACFQLNIVFGILVAYFSNYLIGTFNLGLTEWRWKVGVAAIPAILFFLMLFRIPPQPALARQAGQPSLKPAKSSKRSPGGAAARGDGRHRGPRSPHDRTAGTQPLFSRPLPRTGSLLAISLALFNQFLRHQPAALLPQRHLRPGRLQQALGRPPGHGPIGATNLVFTLVAMSIIDKVGRKRLLLVGAVGTFVCLTLVALIFITRQYSNLILIPLIGFVAFFAVSQGSVIWVYISEIFPNSVRGKGQSLGSSTHWIADAVLTNLYPIVLIHSVALPFIFFASMMVVQFVVVLKFFPETTGYTLEELQQQLETK